VGDGMTIKNARILVVAAATCVLLGSALPSSAVDPLPVLQGLAAEAGSDGPVIHLHATGSFETVHYSPQPGVWVVEMPEASWGQETGFLSDPELGIERAELQQVEEFGRRISRLTVWLVEPVSLEVVTRDQGVDLVFSVAGATESAEPSSWQPLPVQAENLVVAESEPTTAEEQVEAPRPRVTETEVANATDDAYAGASSLLGVAPVLSGEGLMVDLRGDGALQGAAFVLSGPDRIVIDLPGVVNRVNRQLFSVESAAVRRVRVAQFRSLPDPVTRVVVDLHHPVDFTLTPTASGATVVIGDVDRDPAEAVRVARSTRPVVQSSDASTLDIQWSDGHVATETRAEATPSVVSASVFQQPEEVTDSAKVAANPWVADPSQLIEQAPAAQALGMPTTPGDTYASTEVESEEQQYTGEPISLQLKDADIADVLKTFAALTGLNIVLDPGVSGSVTVELHDVPWDQALDLILKINGLDFVLDNNVVRVAPINKLAQEEREAANFLLQQEQARPLKTVVKPLSYAKASYVSGLLTRDSYLLSSRGSVVVDERTNTLILRDVVDRVEGVLRLIDTLDQPTPQVVIEGRIVETTRDFSYELGVNWGFQGVRDAEHGNDTGLEFPNSIEVDGRVGLEKAGNGTISMVFGDILNTFTLDFLLAAAENDGLVRIVSTPRVTTQNLQQARIRSGLQIPVQTVANNTVTVQYVDATLNLQVTPQITAEGTVLLDLDIKKQEAALGLSVQGGNNVPIFTRDARTSLLVRDGGTTVIAGIYQINDQEQKSRVPGLHKIPILGHLFKNKEIFKRHDELLIFITPRIVKY